MIIINKKFRRQHCDKIHTRNIYIFFDLYINHCFLSQKALLRQIIQIVYLNFK